MPLFVSLRALAADPARALDLARAAGLEAIAVADPLAWEPEGRARLGGLEVVVEAVSAEQGALRALNLAAGDEDVRRRSVAAVQATLEWAPDAGAHLVVVEAGDALLEAAHPAASSEAIPPARARDQLLRSLDRLGAIADRRGVALGVRNADGARAAQLGVDPAEIAELLAMLAIPALGFSLDWGALETASARRGFGLERLEACAPRAGIWLRERVQGRWATLRDASRLEAWLRACPELASQPWVMAPDAAGLDRLWADRERLLALLSTPLPGPRP